MPLAGWVNAEIKSLGVYILLSGWDGHCLPQMDGFSNSSIIFKALAAFSVLNMPKKELLFKKSYRLRKGQDKNVCLIKACF